MTAPFTPKHCNPRLSFSANSADSSTNKSSGTTIPMSKLQQFLSTFLGLFSYFGGCSSRGCELPSVTVMFDTGPITTTLDVTIFDADPNTC